MPTPDVSRYYRRALILPILISLAGWAVLEVLPNPLPGHHQGWVPTVANVLLWTGFWAAIPYALFVAIVWAFFRPEGAHAHRRMAVLAPLLIAASFALVIGAGSAVRGDLRGTLDAVALFGGIALAVGAVHASIVIAVVELVAAIVGRRGSSTGDHGAPG